MSRKCFFIIQNGGVTRRSKKVDRINLPTPFPPTILLAGSIPELRNYHPEMLTQSWSTMKQAMFSLRSYHLKKVLTMVRNQFPVVVSSKGEAFIRPPIGSLELSLDSWGATQETRSSSIDLAGHHYVCVLSCVEWEWLAIQDFIRTEKR